MKIIELIKNMYKLSCVFGKKIYYYDVLSRITHLEIFYKKKNESIIEYLEKRYNRIIEQFENLEDFSEDIKRDCPIWIFWAQGFENAPELVQGCLKQLQLIAKNHEIIILKESNYRNYVTIPETIINKFEKGIISLVNFTDILRVSLLAEHGGIWMDATIFLADSIDDYLEKKSFFTINNHLNDSYRYVSNYRWTGFFMACGKNNYFLRYLREIFYEYWKEQNKLIDYFLIDYLMIIGYNNLTSVKNVLDEVPYSNPDIYWLNRNLSEEFDENVFDKIIKSTKVFKLNWRYKIENNSGSYYSVLLQRGNRKTWMNQ